MGKVVEMREDYFSKNNVKFILIKWYEWNKSYEYKYSFIIRICIYGVEFMSYCDFKFFLICVFGGCLNVFESFYDCLGL